jgi:hypothetical protein
MERRFNKLIRDARHVNKGKLTPEIRDAIVNQKHRSNYWYDARGS